MTRARSFLIVVAAALLLARLGPFGTFSELPPGQRVAYWVGLTLLLWLQIEAAGFLLRHWPPAGRIGWAGRAAAAAALGSVPGAFEVAWAESLLRVERDLGSVDILRIYGDVVPIALALAFMLEGVRRLRAPPPPTPTARAASPERLLALLPPNGRGVIRAVSAEDHYLRVHTDRGEALILRRFGETLEDLAGLDGLRVHRGWWVAKEAVEGAEREGDRLVLLLAGGLRVPVSRTYQLAVKEAGFA